MGAVRTMEPARGNIIFIDDQNIKKDSLKRSESFFLCRKDKKHNLALGLDEC